MSALSNCHLNFPYLIPLNLLTFSLLSRVSHYLSTTNFLFAKGRTVWKVCGNFSHAKNVKYWPPATSSQLSPRLMATINCSSYFVKTRQTKRPTTKFLLPLWKQPLQGVLKMMQKFVARKKNKLFEKMNFWNLKFNKNSSRMKYLRRTLQCHRYYSYSILLNR